MTDYCKDKKGWKDFQERVKEANRMRDTLGVYLAMAIIKVKIIN